MIKILLIAFYAFIGYPTTSIYSLQISSISGDPIVFSSYEGKKILLVNIATGSNQANQLHELQAFYQAHKDSIAVVGFPSNSFGNEPQTNSQLRQILIDNYHITFPIAAISNVTGTSANAVYNWLQDKQQNGRINAKISSDFQKYLVNKFGQPIGSFVSTVHVNSEEFLSSIIY